MRGRRLQWAVLVLLAGTAAVADEEAADNAGADERFELNESELEHVTAGTQDTADKLLTIDFARATRSGKSVTGEGSLEVLSSRVPTADMLLLGEGAQGNLNSLVNINALHSEISVLLNLNISIDSTVGTLNQLNVKSALPPAPPPPRR